MQETIREPASGGTQIDGDRAFDFNRERLQRLFQLEAATADEFFRFLDLNAVLGLHLITGFAGHLIVHAHFAGHDQTLGFFATLRELIVEHRLVQAFAG